MKCLFRRFLILLYTIVLIIFFCNILFAASETNRYQGTVDRKKISNTSQTNTRYTPSKNTNYKPYTPPDKKYSYDAGITYTTPTTTSTTQSTTPQRNYTNYDKPPPPAIIGCTACVTGCFSLMPFAIIIIIFLLIRLSRRKILQQIPTNNNLSQNSAQPNPKPRITDFNQGILFYIKEKCPDFNEIAFIDRVNSIFFELQNAKLKKDIKTIRQYVTEGFFNKLKFFINQLVVEHKVQLIKDILVNKISIVKYLREDEIDSITVRLDFSMIEAIIDEKNPSRIYSGSISTPRDISEFWIFTKKDEFYDNSEPAKLEKCPVCGAPARMSENDTCEFCGAKIILDNDSNRYDWLLSDIKPAQ